MHIDMVTRQAAPQSNNVQGIGSQSPAKRPAQQSNANATAQGVVAPTAVVNAVNSDAVMHAATPHQLGQTAKVQVNLTTNTAGPDVPAAKRRRGMAGKAKAVNDSPAVQAATVTKAISAVSACVTMHARAMHVAGISANAESLCAFMVAYLIM